MSWFRVIAFVVQFAFCIKHFVGDNKFGTRNDIHISVEWGTHQISMYRGSDTNQTTWSERVCHSLSLLPRKNDVELTRAMLQ